MLNVYSRCIEIQIIMKPAIENRMESVAKIHISFVLFLLLGAAAPFAVAHDIKTQAFSVGEVKAAVRRFASCVRSGSAVFDSDRKICGVEAETRTELRGYLACPSQKGYMFSRRLESDGQRGRFLFSCAGHSDVVTVISVDSGSPVVTAIGELSR
jgi:hypothetical protein